MAATVHTIQRSIQGEQQAREATAVMDMADVDTYVAKADDKTMKCRLRGHDFPFLRTMTFSEVDDDGLFVQRLKCTCCESAERLERYQAMGRGSNTRWRFVSSKIEYHRRADGTAYTAPPGRGRMYRSQLRSSLVTSVMSSTTPAQVRKGITAARRGA